MDGFEWGVCEVGEGFVGVCLWVWDVWRVLCGVCVGFVWGVCEVLYGVCRDLRGACGRFV